MSGRENGRALKVLILLLALLSLAFLALATFRAGPPPTIEISPGLPAIGKRTPITVKVEEPRRGPGSVRVEFVQETRTQPLAEKALTPEPPWKLWGPDVPGVEIKVEVGRETIQGLVAGTATIRVVAARAGSWIRHPEPTIREISLPVRLTPPSLQVLSTATYLNQGGSEAVVYRVGETTVTDGVRSGEWFFPGSPVPGGGKQDRFAFFGAPHDLSDVSKVRLVAADDVGNETHVSFVDKFFPQRIRTDTIQVTDDFLSKVVPEILSQTPEIQDKGNPLDSYLQINGELRKKNAATLLEMSKRSKETFLWSRSFAPMAGAKVMSSFADRRTYLYQGRTVDHQDHLGFDLASSRGAPVPAANDGEVVLARFFGIYGNAVVIDHGYGLMTLYGHLSSIDVTEGQGVKRGDVVGKTGQTGLAGGDHLHFSVFLRGMSVNPKEWWDDHWIRDRIARKLGPAFLFVGS